MGDLRHRPLTRSELVQLRARAAKVMKTERLPALFPAEAMLPIEACARCLASPGRRILNLSAGPYGEEMARLLKSCAADVCEVSFGWNEAPDMQRILAAMDSFRPEIVFFPSAEAVTGGKMPVREILVSARERGILSVVDAVSSVGADPFETDAWGADAVVCGLQKALLGPVGVSFAAVSERALKMMRENPAVPKGSLLSVPELFDSESEGVPYFLPLLECRSAIDSLQKAEAFGGAEGMVRRHAETAAFVRRRAREMGFALYQPEETCTDLNTVLRVPVGKEDAADALVKREEENYIKFRCGSVLHGGSFGLEGKVFRVDHYGLCCDRDAAGEALERAREALL